MSTLESLWETVEITGGTAKDGGDKKDYPELEDGTHVVVVKAGGADSNSKGDYAYLDLYAPAQNIRERAFWNIAPNEGAIKALKSTLSRLKKKVQSPSKNAIGDAFASTAGYTIEIAKKTNPKGYKNIYVNSVISARALPTIEEKPLTTDEIPF